MKKYQKIQQFRQAIQEVCLRHDMKFDEHGEKYFEHTSPYPILKFKGRVKIHGSNGGIVKYKDRLEFQSRNRVLSIGSDNAGFMLENSAKNLDFLFNGIEFNDYIAVFGEWCGGNIQGGVGVSQLPKMFVIFGYEIDGERIDIYNQDPDQKIYHIDDFGNYDVEIDFNDPQSIQNKLIEDTINIENKCPVSFILGGIEGIGEGIVYTSEDKYKTMFKSKGEKHSSSKVKVLNSIDTESLNSIREFVEYAVTPSRLKQGLENVPSREPKHTGAFIKWVSNDILAEEQDTIIANQINFNIAGKEIAKRCREFFFNNN